MLNVDELMVCHQRLTFNYVTLINRHTLVWYDGGE